MTYLRSPTPRSRSSTTTNTVPEAFFPLPPSSASIGSPHSLAPSQLFSAPSASSSFSSLAPPAALPKHLKLESTSLAGYGLFVSPSTPLPRGTLLLCETPLFTLPSSKASHLPAEPPAAFWDLSNSFPFTSLKQEAQGIIDTNAFALSLPSSAPDLNTKGVVGIFPLTARFNHSCRPNARASYDPLTRQLSVRALRRLDEGEEIKISYLGHGMSLYGASTEERKKRLQRGWGFDCACEACEDAEARDESDGRRGELKVLKAGLPGMWGREGREEEYLRIIGRAKKLMKEEGLEGGWEEWAVVGERVCAGAGDVKSARRWKDDKEGCWKEEVGTEWSEQRVEVMKRRRKDLASVTTEVLGESTTDYRRSSGWFAKLFNS